MKISELIEKLQGILDEDDDGEVIDYNTEIALTDVLPVVTTFGNQQCYGVVFDKPKV